MKTPRPSLRTLPAIFAILAATAQLGDAAQVTLAPSKDNSLIQVTSAAAAAQLSNGLGDIFVGRTNQDGQGPATISKRRGLMAFDIAGSGIPAGATITSVTLTMRDVMGLNGDRNVTLHRTSADWGEGTSLFSGGQGGPATTGDSTWFYRFYDAASPSASTPWATPGGDYVATASGGSIVSDDLGAGQLFTWSSATNPAMIDDIQFWLTNPSSNFGWTLIGDESAGQTAKRLNSSESTIAPNVPPSLVIEYTAVPEPSTLVLATVALIGFQVRRRS